MPQDTMVVDMICTCGSDGLTLSTVGRMVEVGGPGGRASAIAARLAAVGVDDAPLLTCLECSEGLIVVPVGLFE